MALPYKEGGMGFKSLLTIMDYPYISIFEGHFYEKQIPEMSTLTNTTFKARRGMLKCLMKIINTSNWEVGPGNISLLYEYQSGEGCCSLKMLGYAPQRCCKTKFQHKWAPTRNKKLRVEYSLVTIESTKDRRIWHIESRGIFTVKSYY